MITIGGAVRTMAIAVICLFAAANESAAYTRVAAHLSEGEPGMTLSPDCPLSLYDICSGWAWSYSDEEHAVFGTVLNPRECSGGCETGGAVTEVHLYSRCTTTP